MATVTRCLLMFLAAASLRANVRADDIDVGARSGVMLKFLREMVNQTSADTLNLPANASSIRENITDTFSCENRTYGYYADVDNECQVFHVCLTSKGATGRNTTYRWSFICPNETVFNQEVLTCTRPRDSIPCEDSPTFYHLNMEIGKTNDTESPSDSNKDQSKNKRKPVRKQNLIVEKLMTDVVKKIEKEDMKIDDEMDLINPEMNGDKMEFKNEEMSGDTIPVIIEDVKTEVQEVNPEIMKENESEIEMGNARLASERSLKRKGRKISRGNFRFKTDV